MGTSFLKILRAKLYSFTDSFTDLSLTASQLHSFTALQLYSFTALQLYSFTALQLYSFTDSQLHSCSKRSKS